MDSRGFARARGGPREQAAGWTGLAALVCLAGAFVALVGRAQATASALGGAGVVLLVAAIVLSSRASRRARYRPRPMTGLDWGVAAVVWGAPLGLVVLQRIADPVLRWATDPLAFPEFSPLVALLIVLLGIPAIVRPLPPVTVEATPGSAAPVATSDAGAASAVTS